MSRINTNVQSLISQRTLANQNKALNTSMERLSTGLRINRGKDDPAGLIASENLRSEKASITSAISNATRADQVMNIAEGGLQEINSLLLEVQSLVTSSANEAGLSTEEKKANQLQIDSILETIDRISASTSFQGTKLLNGTYGFTISGQHAKVDDVKVNAAKLAYGENRDVNVLITQSAQHAGLVMSFGEAQLNLGAAAVAAPDNKFTFEIAGSKGSKEFTFASGTSLANVISAINTFTDVTGLSASMQGAKAINIKSTDFGSNEYTSVKVIDDGDIYAGGIYQLNAKNETATGAAGTGDVFANLEGKEAQRDSGQDVGAIVNGIQATADGNRIQVRTDNLDVELQLADSGVHNLGALDGFTITGGGAQFNLGPSVDIINQATIGIDNVSVRNLGTFDAGYLDELGSSKGSNLVDGDLGKAQKIVDAAINQVSSLRGRIGAFQKNTIGSTINSLNVALENTSAAESSIRDTNFAAETAEMTRSQILSQAAQNVLGTANSSPQSVLSLLGR